MELWNLHHITSIARNAKYVLDIIHLCSRFPLNTCSKQKNIVMIIYAHYTRFYCLQLHVYKCAPTYIYTRFLISNEPCTIWPKCTHFLFKNRACACVGGYFWKFWSVFLDGSIRDAPTILHDFTVYSVCDEWNTNFSTS